MMRKIILLVVALIALNVNAVNWNNAQWIWQEQDGPSNTWMSFRKTINVDAVPDSVSAQIAVDSKFWLWVNGEMVIFEGGYSRGPSQAGAWDRDAEIMPTNSWYETINIQPYLKEGENTIAILTWYWGRMTYKGTHVDSKKGGMLFHSEIGDQTIVSDATWKAIQHPGYDNTIEPASASLVQYPVKFDAQKGMNDWSDTAWYTSTFDDTQWPAAVEKGANGAAPWYDLIETYVPRLINHGLVDYENNTSLNLPFVSTGKTYECVLPFNKQITPYLEVEAEAGKTITITTDNRLNKITGTYITKGGIQSFESFSWMNGHTVNYTIPAGVTVKALKYRWMSVGEMSGSYEVSDPFYQRLWEMGNNTLFVCARDNFMDCPDRERALWIGDVADQAGYLFYCMDDVGRQLLKKAILQTCYFSDNKVLGALGPGRVRELVGQSLQFISQLVWPYYLNTGDLETLEIAYDYAYDYLALFSMQANGLPEYRKGKSSDAWDWLDWGVDNTIDKYPIQPAYYYEALARAKDMAEVLDKTEHMNFYTTRMSSIEANYDKVYWKNGFYSSNASKFKDDRANALAITSGLANPENYAAIVENVLVPNKYSSPHFEWVVEEAMFIAGKYTESLARMKEQYESQVNSGLSTLYEMFPKGGSYNHAWNGSNTVLSKYVAGIKPLEVAWSSFEVSPVLVHLTSLKTKVPTVKGDILVDVTRSTTEFTLDLESPEGTSAIVGIHKDGATILDVKVGGQIIWKDGAFVSGVSGISFESESDEFLKFKVGAGTWNIQASIYKDYPPTVAFTSPADNTVLDADYSELEVSVNATDENGITKVELFLDDQLLDTKTSAPFDWSATSLPNLLGWSLGKHSLKVKATDTNNQSSEASIGIMVIKLSIEKSLHISFEDGAISNWETDGNDYGVTPEILDGTNTRAGSKVIALDYSDKSSGHHVQNIIDNILVPDQHYFHMIAYSATSDIAYGQTIPTAKLGDWAPTPPITNHASNLVFERKVTSRQNTQGADLNCYPRLRSKANGACVIYYDDIVLYSDANSTADLTAPASATDFTLTPKENGDELSWTEGVDAGTGVQETFVLRTASLEASASQPLMQDQVAYSIAGDATSISQIGDWVVLAQLSVGTTTYIDSNKEDGQSYKYAIVHKDLAYNYSIPLMDGEAASIEDDLFSNKLQLYPNPADQELRIIGVKVLRAEVYNLSGQLLIDAPINSNQIDVSQLKRGVYLIHIEGDRGRAFIEKIVIE